MKSTIISIAAAAVAMVALTIPGQAQDAASASEQAKMKLAAGLIAVGRVEQDPMMLLVGAKLLAGLEGGTEGDAPANASKAFDVSQVLEEAKALAGDSELLMAEIAAVSGRAERGQRYCNWYTNCGYDITDPFACEEVYVCN